MRWPWSKKIVVKKEVETKEYTPEQLGALFNSWSSRGVNKVNALSDTTVLGAISALSQDIAKIALNFKKRVGDESFNDFKSPLFHLFNYRPNSFQSAFEFKEYTMWNMLLDGNAYSLIVRDKNSIITELIPINPGRVTLLESDGGEIFYQVTPSGTFEQSQVSEKTFFPADAIWHLKYMPCGSGLTGTTPIKLAIEALKLSLGLKNQAFSSVENGAQLGGVIEAPGTLSEPIVKRLKSSWEDNYAGSSKAGKTAILEEGMKFNKLQMSAVDSEMIEQMKLSVLDVCRMFRMPPSKLMDTSHSTYSNQEEESLNYLKDTLLPHFERWESSLNFSLLGGDAEYFFEFDVTRLTRGDSTARNEAYANGRQWGYYSTNDIRKMEGLQKIEGGDSYIVPLNMSDINKIEEAEPDAPKKEVANDKS